MAGDQEPVKPLLAVVGKSAKAAPVQIEGTEANVGSILGITSMVSVVVVAQSPAVGVNV
jgi:hypothetical protein